jgi:hypothetical protein
LEGLDGGKLLKGKDEPNVNFGQGAGRLLRKRRKMSAFVVTTVACGFALRQRPSAEWNCLLFLFLNAALKGPLFPGSFGRSWLTLAVVPPLAVLLARFVEEPGFSPASGASSMWALRMTISIFYSLLDNLQVTFQYVGRLGERTHDTDSENRPAAGYSRHAHS